MAKVLNPKPKFISVQSFENTERADLMPYLRKKMIIFGCWPTQNSKQALRWFIILMVIIFNTIPTIIGAYKLSQTNIIECMQAMCEVCAISYWSFRMIYISYRWKDVVRFLSDFQDVWNVIRDVEIDKWQERVKSFDKLTNQLSTFVYWLYFIIGISYELVALWLSMNRHFDEKPGPMFYGIHADFIIDTKYNLTYYLLLYFPLTIVQVVYCVIYASIEVLLLFLIRYSALYFELIKIKLSILDEKLKGMTAAEAKDEIIKIIKDHEVAIRCVSDFEELFKVILLANFIMNSFVICFFIFAIYKLFLDSIINFVIFVGFAFALHLNLVFFSFFSQKLLDESNAVAHCAWNLAWYDENVEFQNTIRFIIARAQKPVGVTAAGFYYISLESYYNVLKASYSYFTLMNSFVFA